MQIRIASKQKMIFAIKCLHFLYFKVSKCNKKRVIRSTFLSFKQIIEEHKRKDMCCSNWT